MRLGGIDVFVRQRGSFSDHEAVLTWYYYAERIVFLFGRQSDSIET